jgi:hypothetical protein
MNDAVGPAFININCTCVALNWVMSQLNCEATFTFTGALLVMFTKLTVTAPADRLHSRTMPDMQVNNIPRKEYTLKLVRLFTCSPSKLSFIIKRLKVSHPV